MYPAKDAPTQGNPAGVKAGALPEFCFVEVGGGGDGLFRMPIYGKRGCRERYGLYGRRPGFLPLSSLGLSALTNSECKRGMKPGNMAVPPTTNIEEINPFRKSRGTYTVPN